MTSKVKEAFMRGIVWKAGLTAVILVLSFYFVLPTARLLFMSSEQKKSDPELVERLQQKGVKLGLDLQGGTHLVFEVDTTKLPADIAEIPINEALEVIRSRVDQYGVAEPTIQRSGDMRIIVELPGIQNIENAKKLIQETAVLEFRLLRDRKDVLDFANSMDKLLRENPELLENAKKPVFTDTTTVKTQSSGEATDVTAQKTDSAAADTSKKPAPVAQKTDTTTKMVAKVEKKDTTAVAKSPKTGADIFGKAKDTTKTSTKTDTATTSDESGEKPFSDFIEMMDNVMIVRASDYEIVDRLLAMPEARALLTNSILLWETDFTNMDGSKVRMLYLLSNNVELTGASLTKASWNFGSGYDPKTAGRPVIQLEFDKDGARKFAQTTERNLKKRLAIVLNEKVYTAPEIQDKIRNGQAIIRGIKDVEEAKIITIVLKAGSLPVPLKIVEERTVGPTLGEDSIRSGITAGLIGLFIVVIFMMIYYKFSGLIANIALLLNIIILMAALSLMGSTLTLPGIAGIILTIGMAVDANVLIFERIREELAAGRTVRMAIDAGYDRAFLTIVDSNVTTLMAAIVLFYFGSGPIRGFAVTLSIGLLVSMFTAIFVTRIIFTWYIATFNKDRISI